MALGLLPWDYGVRNLLRRPSRTLLTMLALTVVVLLVLVVVAFIRGLERSLATSGDPRVVLVYSVSTNENIETSSIAARTPALLEASIHSIQRRYGLTHLSPELFLGSRVVTQDSKGTGLGLIRGVTLAAPLVRRVVRLTEGRWPEQGEVIVGKLVAAKLGCTAASLAIGETIEFENRRWQICGVFSAEGAAFESEIWCPLPDFQQALKRQDLSLVAALLKPGTTSVDLELFCKQRLDLELQALKETEYYQLLQKHYRPMRVLAWLVVCLVSAAGIFAGLNMMYGAVAGRIRELGTLQAIGYRPRAIVVAILQEGLLLSAASSLLAGIVGLLFINGLAVRFTMGAFTLRVDSLGMLVGCTVGVLLGGLGAMPPAFKALRVPVAESIKAV